MNIPSFNDIIQEKMGFYNGWGSAFDRLEIFAGILSNKRQSQYSFCRILYL
jgi:hypothetical protein